MKDKISLAGDLGSGKSTVSKILIDALGAEYYSTGSIVRAIAERMGMTVGELNKYMETHPEIDTEIDDGLKRLALDERLLIIDSRMAWHFTPGTFRVYLTTDIETASLRIMNANRRGEHSNTLADTVLATRARRLSEQKRYMEQYGVDINDLSNYALVVDTTNATPEEVASVIISSFERWQTSRELCACYITPERLNYVDDEQDGDELSRLASLLESGAEIPPVTVFECDGEFYVEDGIQSALAYALNFNTFVPVTLVRGEVGDRKYVKMKNSL